MKKSLLLLLAAAAVVGCAKETDSPTQVPVNPDAIMIGANLSAPATKATLPIVFGEGSQIGMYEAFFDGTKAITGFRKDNTATVGSEVYNENLQYKFGANVTAAWANVDAQKILTWAYMNDNKEDGDKAIYLVGYHPYGTVKFDRNEFKLPLDQTTEEALKKSDLMWAMTTGSTGTAGTFKYEQQAPGYTVAEIKTMGLTKTNHSSKAIDMMFHHMLSKLSYKVRFTKPTGAADKFENPVISQIKILGPEITVAGNLDLKAGTYASTANAAGVAPEIFWAPTEAVKYLKENGDPIALKETGVAAADDDYVFCCDLIAQPADFTGKLTNYFEFTVTYDFTAAAVGSVKETRTQTYRYQLAKVADFMKFERNKQYNVKAAIELNTENIFVTAQIAPWAVVDVPEIQPK